jgi:hypothetical protein
MVEPFFFGASLCSFMRIETTVKKNHLAHRIVEVRNAILNPQHHLRNSRGQAAIFIALIFNILFVFFAMAINVALVIHDKINLQNSVDLAAYYAASKEAELFNAMAHENYAIRQSWKVLTWRYRVLGTMGLIDSANKNPVWTGEMSDTPYPAGRAPALCVTYKPTWQEVPPNESLCNKPYLRIPALPEVKVIAGFLGINAAIAALSRQLIGQFNATCQDHGAYNWWFAMSIMHAYRLDQRNRKQVIYALAENLSGGQNGDFKDLDGNSVFEGAKQTFLKNLTYTNRQSVEEFTMMNSLEGLAPRTTWLPEIQIVPTMIYTDTKNETDCVNDPQPVTNLPQRQAARDKISEPWPSGLGASNLIPWATAMGGFLKDSDYQFSLGVEKNPWYMPYMGIKVKTHPRQIFFPIGNGLGMVARAFAKPFGGRMGPWYGAEWPAGSPNSDGKPVDMLLPPRMAAGGLMNSSDPTTRLPNYSRFPGDTMGMTSKMAINSLAGLATLGIKFDYYKNIKEDLGPGVPNDILAWNGPENKAPDVRFYELAIAAPDLFDVTYYSIEPNFQENYLDRLIANKAIFKIPFDVPLRPDLGANGTAVETFSVQKQMEAVQAKNLQKDAAFFFIREKAHLLTAWLPGPGGFNYKIEDSFKNFGKCALPDTDLKFRNPGSCVAGGGRTGYSVKLISRDALVSPLHAIGGGAGGAANAILNPPKPSDGW